MKLNSSLHVWLLIQLSSVESMIADEWTDRRRCDCFAVSVSGSRVWYSQSSSGPAVVPIAPGDKHSDVHASAKRDESSSVRDNDDDEDEDKDEDKEDEQNEDWLLPATLTKVPAVARPAMHTQQRSYTRAIYASRLLIISCYVFQSIAVYSHQSSDYTVNIWSNLLAANILFICSKDSLLQLLEFMHFM